MDHARLEQLPINGRNVSTLMATVPGYEGTGRVFGTPTDGREWILDGAVVTDRRWAGDPMTQPALDSIQEFTVQANAISAKLSRPVSLIMTVKSGTNQFHGTAFETTRNNAIGLARARTDYYTDPAQTDPQRVRRQRGGPVILPKYNGKNRTFWFFNFEGQQNSILHHGELQRADRSDAQWRFQRRGRFASAVCRPSTIRCRPGKDGSRTPFAMAARPTSSTPAARTRLAKYLFGITPMPTNGANPLLDVNWFGPAPNLTSKWGMTGRVDQRSPKATRCTWSSPTTTGGTDIPPTPAASASRC